jgi:molybdopterin-guanine dinucleotide biosynthesis protein A
MPRSNRSAFPAVTLDRPASDDGARPSITGVVLAGGLSRRMGGGDKGLADLGGRSMLAHVVARLGPQVGTLVLNANGDPARFASLGLPVAADTLPDFPGPLAGVLAGMRWALRHTPGATHIVTVSADAPLIPHDLVARLAAALAPPGATAIAVAQSDSGLHPVIAMWPVALADDLESALRDGLRQVRRWMDRHGAVPVTFPSVQRGSRVFDPFFNANTPEDLALLRTAFAEDGA